MPELRVRVSDDELQTVETQARKLGMTRREYVRAQLFAKERPVTDAELHAMVAAKARAGNMRAIEILARQQAVTPASTTPTPSAEPAKADDPFAEVDELAKRRTRAG